MILHIGQCIRYKSRYSSWRLASDWSRAAFTDSGEWLLFQLFYDNKLYILKSVFFHAIILNTYYIHNIQFCGNKKFFSWNTRIFNSFSYSSFISIYKNLIGTFSHKFLYEKWCKWKYVFYVFSFHVMSFHQHTNKSSIDMTISIMIM